MTMKRCLLMAVAALTAMSQLNAQGLWRVVKRADSLLTARYRRGNVDTAYVVRPATNWTLTARLNMYATLLEMEGRQDGTPFTSKMQADYKTTFSVGVNYLGVAVSLSLNPAKLLGKYKDFEVNLSSYGRRWGFDVGYQDARNFTGWYQDEGEPRIELPPEVLTMKALNANAYYVLNHRRFSYPAAFSQSYIQRRSAGSFLLGLSGLHMQTETSGAFESLLKMTNIGLGAGYGYNWVPWRNWLFHLSVLPTLTVFSHTSLTVSDDRIPLDYHFPEVIVTSRAAIVRQFGNMFAGTRIVYHFTNIGDRDKLSLYHNKWHARLFVGLRL
jgi:hypothetical protein